MRFTRRILICDPESEYFPLVERLGGQVIRLTPSGSGGGRSYYLNPLDINLNYSEDDNPLALKSDFILSFCEVAAGDKFGLTPVEKTIIDRSLRKVYRGYLADPRPENMPILEDLWEEIRAQPEPEAQRVSSALELYVHGSLNVFNHRTNVDINNRLVCFDIKSLGKQLKNLGMLVIQDQVWNRVTVNRSEGKATRYYVDEFHLLLHGEVASWSVEIWKRFRKWGGIPTGITQNVKDLLGSPEIENILENSDFIYLLNQASGDRAILCERLNISAKQAAHISNVGDLVVHGMDGFAGSIGISDSRGKASPVLNVLETDQNKRYIMYYLRSMAYSDVFLALATGIRVRSCDLRWNKLAELSYPVPPLNEQNAIVKHIDSVISKADAVIADKKAQLATLDEYKKSLIFEYVTGKKEVI